MENDELLSAGEVAKILGVDPKTVTRWANNGDIPCVRLPKGHRRYRRSVVQAILDGTF